MQPIQRLMINICSKDLNKSKNFYQQLFDLETAFESDWYIQLTDKNRGFELGIITQQHDLVPPAYQQNPTGFYLTFVVADVEVTYSQAKAANFEIVSPPTNMPYGQRRLLLKDPDGTLVDVSSLILKQ